MTLETRVRVARSAEAEAALRKKRSQAGTIGSYVRQANHPIEEIVGPMQRAAETALNAKLAIEHGYAHLPVGSPEYLRRQEKARSAHFRQMRMKRS